MQACLERLWQSCGKPSCSFGSPEVETVVLIAQHQKPLLQANCRSPFAGAETRMPKISVDEVLLDQFCARPLEARPTAASFSRSSAYGG